MKSIRLEVVTVDRVVMSEDVYSIVAPAYEGYLGILPGHAPLIAVLTTGQLKVRKLDGAEIFMALAGGFMEVNPRKVAILADAAEFAEEIDAGRAEAARDRALRRLKERGLGADIGRAQHALARANNRLKVRRRMIK